jgi:hypothetical protein
MQVSVELPMNSVGYAPVLSVLEPGRLRWIPGRLHVWLRTPDGTQHELRRGQLPQQGYRVLRRLGHWTALRCHTARGTSRWVVIY